MHEVIYEADTRAGRFFDVCLLVLILISVIAVLLESVQSIAQRYGALLLTIEWGCTILFTLEYFARIIAVKKPIRYMTSFFGVIDLLSIAPTYLSFFIGGAQTMIIIRILRLLRVFRIFKLARYLNEANVLVSAMRSSRFKITVFLTAVLSIVFIMGGLMYLVEGPENGFTSIPRSIYWAIVTLTTVGYGDIAPQTVWGQTIAVCVMISGYAIIAVPTGIVSAELVAKSRKEISRQACPQCGREGHDVDAKHCKYCGGLL